MPLRLGTPSWGLVPTLVLALVCGAVAPVLAQPKKGAPTAPVGPAVGDKTDKPDAKSDKGKGKVKNFDFKALDLNGHMRTPQQLYFLERANEELERASLETRSFIPAMAKSVEEEQ